MRVKKILPWLILFIFATLATAFSLTEIYQLLKPIDRSEPITKESGTRENKTITMILAGDIMLDRGVGYMVEKQGNNDFRFPFLKIAGDLKRADVFFGNLEGPISDKGTKVGSIYSFQANPETIEGLTFAGFNIISLANNHAFDYGKTALEDTFLRLREAKVDEHSLVSPHRSARIIDYVGAGFSENEAYSPIVKEINNSTGTLSGPRPGPSPQVKIAFLAYTNLGPKSWKAGENNSGIAWISEKDFEKIKRDIGNAKSKSDILVVSLHAGEEYARKPTQFQVDFSKMAIDAGADIVIGHHPHIVQPNEKYKNGYIFYSLGNFVFDQSFSEETMRGQIVEVLIENKKIKEIIAKEIKINNFFQPEILE